MSLTHPFSHLPLLKKLYALKKQDQTYLAFIEIDYEST